MKYFSPEHRANIRKALLGRKITWAKKISEAHKGIIVESTRGKNHWKFKEGKISLSGIHNWIRLRKIKPDKCELCNKEKRLELSNKDHKYSRNVEDYQYTCRSCHRKWDIKYNGLTNHKKMPQKRWPTSGLKNSCSKFPTECS